MPSNDLTGDVIDPDLGRHILAELADLNADFIALAIKLDDAGEHTLMPSGQVDELRRLTEPAVRRLSGCAFALFDLRLQDTALFQALRDGEIAAELSQVDEQDADNVRSIKLFTLSALMYLRHLAEINRFFAGLSFDAAPETLDIVNGLPLNRLRDIADACPALLRSRFGTFPRAWDDLLKLARRNDTEPMLPSKILGYQHLSHK